MFFLRVFLAAVAIAVTASEPAHAEPITIAIFGAAFAATTVGEIVSIGIGLALSYGVSLIEKALAPKPKATTDTAGVELDVDMGDDVPISFIAGRFATAGRRKYIGSWGSDGNTPNAYLTDVIELSNMPSYAGARGLNSLWINDAQATVLWDQPHPDGRGYPISQFRVKNKDYLWIKYYDGTQTAPDAFVVSKFGTNERQFFSDMIGYGCQYVVLTSRINQDLFSGGIPQGLYEPAPIPLYDIRKDSTNGGSGGHRWGVPTTYSQTTNPAVIIYNIIRGVYYGSEWVYGGQNLAAFRLPASNWIAAANACDVGVANADGSVEPAYRAGYEFKGDEKPSDAIEKIRKAANGRIAEVGGIFKMLVGAPGGAVFGFTDDDILVTEEQTYTPFPTLDDTVNGIEATYPEPTEKWASKDAPARYSPNLEVLDGNRRLAVSVTFEAVPFANQVQRLMVAMIQEDRRFRQHTFYLPPDAYTLEPNDVVSYTSERNGYSNKKFLVVSIVGPRSFNQLVTLKEIDPSDYDWSSDLQLPTTTGWIGPITLPSQPMTGWTVEPATVQDDNGIDRRPAIKINCAGDLDDVNKVWVQVRLKATQAVVFDSDQTPYGVPYSWTISGLWTLANTEYEARGKYVPYTNRPTDFSAWLTVTTPNVLIATIDIFDNAIIASKIADAAISAEKIMNDAITSLKLADDAVSTAKLQVGAVSSQIIGTGAVVAESIAAGAVTAIAIAAGAVTATSIAAETITGDKIAANTIGANLIAADAITARSLVLTDFSNIVDNGWQAGNLDGWSTTFVNNFYLNTDLTPTGAADAAGWTLDTIGQDAISNTIACSIGDAFSFDVWVYNKDDGNASIYATVATAASGGTSGQTTDVLIATTALKNQWVRLLGKYTVTAGKVSVAMKLNRATTSGSGSSTLWSKPAMRRAANAALIVDGSITANQIAANSITADRLQVTSLAAISAVLGRADISSAYIGTLTVGTSNIQAGACTANATAGAGSFSVGSGSNAGIIGCSIVAGGDGYVVIHGNAFATPSNTAAACPVYYCIYRDGNLLYQPLIYLPTIAHPGAINRDGLQNPTTWTASGVMPFLVVDAPGPGNHYYQMNIYPQTDTIPFSSAYMSATAYKR